MVACHMSLPGESWPYLAPLLTGQVFFLVEEAWLFLLIHEDEVSILILLPYVVVARLRSLLTMFLLRHLVLRGWYPPRPIVRAVEAAPTAPDPPGNSGSGGAGYSRWAPSLGFPAWANVEAGAGTGREFFFRDLFSCSLRRVAGPRGLRPLPLPFMHCHLQETRCPILSLAVLVWPQAPWGHLCVEKSLWQK